MYRSLRVQVITKCCQKSRHVDMNSIPEIHHNGLTMKKRVTNEAVPFKPLTFYDVCYIIVTCTCISKMNLGIFYVL